jgi:hypothetical protein
MLRFVEHRARAVRETERAAEAVIPHPLTGADVAQAAKWGSRGYAATRGLGVSFGPPRSLIVTMCGPTPFGLRHEPLFRLSRIGRGITSTYQGANATHGNMAAALAYIARLIRDADAERPTLPAPEPRRAPPSSL